jgi:hypothetical protein
LSDPSSAVFITDFSSISGPLQTESFLTIDEMVLVHFTTAEKIKMLPLA